jgi:hypothetical protein
MQPKYRSSNKKLPVRTSVLGGRVRKSGISDNSTPVKTCAY